MPEPSTIILIGSGLLGLAGFRVTRKNSDGSSAKRIFVIRRKHPLARTRMVKSAQPAGEKETS